MSRRIKKTSDWKKWCYITTLQQATIYTKNCGQDIHVIDSDTYNMIMHVTCNERHLPTSIMIIYMYDLEATWRIVLLYSPFVIQCFKLTGNSGCKSKIESTY